MTLYLSPTKALAADQLAAIRALKLPTVRAETYDGDTDPASRRWIRDHANFILANPDMLHFGILPNHAWWARFFRRLRYVIVDEAHSYRGVFGSHVANLMRRLRRICAYYSPGGSHPGPVFIAASATASEPGTSFGRLIGAPVRAVSEDCSPHGSTTVAFWEPALTELRGENGAKERRTAVAETADLLANLVSSRIRTIAFIKSRRGAETISSIAKRLLDEVDPSLPQRVAAYRSGYLPEERRALEKALRSGELLGVSSTSALELGIDISGLDAVLVAGWPGTRASLFQQIGRAGRAGQDAIAAFVASDDPLDTYLVNHPEAIFDVSVEATVFDPSNPYVLGPHLCAAAAELPLGFAELELFGATAEKLLDQLVAQGYLRKRPAGWFWTHPQSAAAMVNLRADGGGPVSIVDADTGSLLGTMDSPQTHYQAHTGAVYVHQGDSYVVEDLNEDDHCVVVRRANPDYYTTARDVTQIEVLETRAHHAVGRRGRALRRCESDDPGGLLPAQGADFERDSRRRTPGTGRPGPVHQGGLVCHGQPLTDRRGTDRGAVPRSPARRRTRRHRPPAAGGFQRPLGHRRGLHGHSRRHRGADDLRLRRPSRRGRLRRTRLRQGPGVADRHAGRHQGLRMRVRLPVLCPVTQMRQQEQPAGQGRRGHPDRRAAQGRHRLMNTGHSGHTGRGRDTGRKPARAAPRLKAP